MAEHGTTCPCAGCSAARDYTAHLMTGGRDGHPICCVCPTCGFARMQMRAIDRYTEVATERLRDAMTSITSSHRRPSEADELLADMKIPVRGTNPN